ncbi:S8 family peptidase [Lysobacter brunescens]|uniref:S8 family peptidase n=1 Tax=Lysobacter brunescens TaxID=262323 RepID=A0ABW2YE13_9GAMM
MKHRALSLSVAALLMAAASPSFAGKAHLDGLRSDTAFDQFIVRYRNGSAERTDRAAIDRGLARASRAIVGKRTLAVKHFRRMSLGADVIRTDRKLDRVDAETLMRQIAADPNVEYVEVDVRMHPTLTPNDPRYPDQWHYFNPTTGINLPNAWDKSTGSGIVVAVLDTGSTPHSDLNSNTVAGYDFISNTTTAQDGNGRDNNPNDPGDWFTNWACGGAPDPQFERRDSSWHGTHVAGTIGALTNNGNGVAGVAYGARIQHVRVLGRCGGSLSDIADGVIWASGGTVSGIPANQTPARIINMSLGGGGTCSIELQNAINSAVGRSTTVIVAAGNNNGNAANVQPANCANVVVVGATDINGARSVWSSTQQSNFGGNVDLSAPGSGIWSTLNTGTQGQGTETYASYNGTSMATPHVAGVAALVQSRRQAAGQSLFTPAQLETHLRNNVRPFPATPDQPIGTGIVNADAAVTAAVPPPSAPVINSFTCSGTGGGYCSVSATSSTPMTYAWSGGFSNSCTGPTCSNVCGTLGSFTIKVTVTVTNSIGSTSADAWPFCQRSW